MTGDWILQSPICFNRKSNYCRFFFDNGLQNVLDAIVNFDKAIQNFLSAIVKNGNGIQKTHCFNSDFVNATQNVQTCLANFDNGIQNVLSGIVDFDIAFFKTNNCIFDSSSVNAMQFFASMSC